MKSSGSLPLWEGALSDSLNTAETSTHSFLQVSHLHLHAGAIQGIINRCQRPFLLAKPEWLTGLPVRPGGGAMTTSSLISYSQVGFKNKV